MTQPSLFFDRRCTVKKLRKFGAHSNYAFMKHSRPTRGCQKARTTAARWNDLLGCLASALHASQREVTHGRSASHTDWQRRQVDAASITATGQHKDSVAYT